MEERVDKKDSGEIQPLQKLDGKFTKRHLVALLVCMGSMNMFILRSNLTIAIVEMMSNKTLVIDNRTITVGPEFAWDSKTRGFILSLFYYGYLATPLGGYIASKYGGVNTYGFGILVTAILTVTTPFNLRLNFYWFVFCRIVEGIAEAISYTSIVDIGSKWARPEERSKFVAFGFTGIYVGTTVSFPLCGYLAHRFDWTAVFYGTGTIALLWTTIWFLVVPSEPPDESRSLTQPITNKNRLKVKIMKSSFIGNNKVSYPWKQIATCKTLWALSAARISYAWGYNIVVLCLPLYLKDVTTENTNNIGILSAIPNFVSIFAVPLFGCLVDYLVNAKICTATVVHKMYLSGSLSLAAVILVSITFMEGNISAVIISLAFFKILLSFAFVVSQVMPLCIAPSYSSLICGIAALWHTIAMIVSPVYIGFVVTHQTAAQWGICFISTAIVMVIGAAIFLLFASSEPQSWAIQGDEENKNRTRSHELSQVTEKFLNTSDDDGIK